jgi:hypothetical protein
MKFAQFAQFAQFAFHISWVRRFPKTLRFAKL